MSFPVTGPTLVKRLFHREEIPPFYSLLNLWAIEEGILIGLDLQFSAIFEMELPDPLHKGEPEEQAFFTAVQRALQGLPDNVTVQFLIRVRTGNDETIKRYVSSTEAQTDVTRFIVDQKAEHFGKADLHRRHYYLFVTTHAENIDLLKFRPSPFRFFLPSPSGITEPMHQRRVRELEGIVDALSSQLNAAGDSGAIKLRRMGREDITSFLYEWLNPGRALIVPPPAVRQSKTLRSQIAFNACEAGFDHVYMDGRYHRGINLHTRFESIHQTHFANFLTQITNFQSTKTPAAEKDMDIVVTVHTLKQEEAIKSLSFQSYLADVIGNINVFKKDYGAEMMSTQGHELLTTVKDGFQKLFDVSLCVVLRDGSLETLTERTNHVLRSFPSLGDAEGVIDDMSHLPLFLSVLPNHGHLNTRRHMFHTDAVAQIIPITAPWAGSAEPKILFQTDDSQLLPFDLFDPKLPAKHGLCLGSSGSGKSFTINYILTNFFIESDKNHIIVIDVGGSYRKICQLFGGEYLEIELSDKFAFNPFPPRSIAVINDKPEGFEVDPDVISFLTTVVQKMLKLTELSGRAQLIMERAVTDVYKLAKNDPPLLSSLHSQLKDYKGDDEDKALASGFAKDLELWTAGRYSKMVNRPNSLNPRARLVVFDLQKLEQQPDLLPVIFFLIKNVIYNKLMDISLRKWLVVDEAWKFFKDEAGSKLIIDLYKTARKFNGAIFSISQSIDDFLKTPAAGAVIDNSKVKFVLPIATQQEALKEFELTPPDIEEVKGLKRVSGRYSEVFLKFNKESRVIRIQPSRVDYSICTTSPDDLNREKDLRLRNPEFSELQVIQAMSGMNPTGGHSND